MITRKEKEDALINKFKAEQEKKTKGYIKKMKGCVDCRVDEEYNLVILGKIPKAKKEKKSYDFGVTK